MALAEFGTYDIFQWIDIEAAREPVDAYEQHLREVELAEKVGFKYHFVIEHQNSYVGQCTSPPVYLSALAQRTKTMRFGTMIFLLPFGVVARIASSSPVC